VLYQVRVSSIKHSYQWARVHYQRDGKNQVNGARRREYVGLPSTPDLDLTLSRIRRKIVQDSSTKPITVVRGCLIHAPHWLPSHPLQLNGPTGSAGFRLTAELRSVPEAPGTAVHSESIQPLAEREARAGQYHPVGILSLAVIQNCKSSDY